jgi:hypothetical protein
VFFLVFLPFLGLQKLAELKDKGAISAEEFDVAKAKLLA